MEMRAWKRFQARLNEFRSPAILSSRKAYSIWADTYVPRPHNGLMVLEQEAVLRVLPDLRNGRVLDLACGSGRYAQVALTRGASRVIGLDHSPHMLRHAEGFPRVMSDMTALPFGSSAFDAVICGLATGHVPPGALPGIFAEMARILRPGGTIVVSDLHPYLFMRGERRTFIAKDGQSHSVEHYPHHVSHYFSVITQAGLTLSSLVESDVVIDGKSVPAVLVIGARLER